MSMPRRWTGEPIGMLKAGTLGQCLGAPLGAEVGVLDEERNAVHGEGPIGEGDPPFDELAVVAGPASMHRRAEGGPGRLQAKHGEVDVVDEQRVRRKAAAGLQRPERSGIDRRPGRKLRVVDADQLEVASVREPGNPVPSSPPPDGGRRR